MTARERYLLALSHREADHIPVWDSPWTYSIARWHKEGLPEEQWTGEYFGWDEIMSQGPDISFQFPREVIEDTDTYQIYRDEFGNMRRSFKDHESTPELMDFTVKDRRVWHDYKPRLAWNDKRVKWEDALKLNQRAYDRGAFVVYSTGLGYDFAQNIVRSDHLLMAIAEDPAWVKDLLETIADLVITGLEEMLTRGFRFDGAWFYDDLGYRKATFFSPATFRELEFPSQKRLYDFCHSKGLRTILHSCGNIRAVVPQLIEAGLDCLQPLEVKAGMDVVELKKDFGDALTLFGGIDARAMADPDPRVIEREISTKIPVAKRGGGYIYHSDHSVPNNVSWEQYKRVMELVYQYGNY